VTSRLDRRKKKYDFPQEKWVVADVTIRMPIDISTYPEPEDNTLEACQKSVDYLYHEHLDFSDTYLSFARFAYFLSRSGRGAQRKLKHAWKHAYYGNFKIKVVYAEEMKVDKSDRAIYREWLDTELKDKDLIDL
jgi:hypothetical protein